MGLSFMFWVGVILGFWGGVNDKRFLRPSRQGLRARLNGGLLSYGGVGVWGVGLGWVVYFVSEEMFFANFIGLSGTLFQIVFFCVFYIEGKK